MDPKTILIGNDHGGYDLAAQVLEYLMGKMTRAHNNSNCLCLGGRITGAFEALDILEAWLATPYDGGRHDISLGLIAEAEATLCNPGGWTPSGPMR